jgi:hypothetical protein
MLTYRTDHVRLRDRDVNRSSPFQLWKQLSPERKLQAAEAFWHDDNAGVEQAEAWRRSRNASNSASRAW